MVMMSGATMLSGTEFVEGGVEDASDDTYLSGASSKISASMFIEGGVLDASNDTCSSGAAMFSAADFLEGGAQDESDDSCSICLESFCDSDPSTVTTCNHEFHLHCILEWGQRGKECPMCWQHLSLKNLDSQTLLAASQQQRHAQRSPFHQRRYGVSNWDNLEVEHRSMSERARGARAFDRDSIMDPYSIRQLSTMERQEEIQHGRSSSDPSVSETLKSRLVAASFKYRDSFSKTTRGLRERLRLRNHATVA